MKPLPPIAVTATEEVCYEQYHSLLRGVGAGWFTACQRQHRSQGQVVVPVDRRMPQHGRPQVPFLFVLTCLRLLPGPI
jgi:hypothetical protein